MRTEGRREGLIPSQPKQVTLLPSSARAMTASSLVMERTLRKLANTFAGTDAW